MTMGFEAIVIGVSWGGAEALQKILPALPEDFKVPVIIVQHLGSESGREWIEILDRMSAVRIKEADEKEQVLPGIVYIAPANYHLLIEEDRTFSLSMDERVNFARPSIDVLFDCAADVYEDKVIGIILTGLNKDGAAGLRKIKENGGLAIVQDPGTTQADEMPLSAIAATQVDYVLSLEGITALLLKLNNNNFNTL